MSELSLDLPVLQTDPNNDGLTILIDNGVPLRFFEDVMESMACHISFVKFGWGTALVTPKIKEKIRCLRDHGIEFFFGGTLFEKAFYQGKVDDYYEYCLRNEATYVEISNGTIPMENSEKAEMIFKFSKDFKVFSEVGYKDTQQSLNLPPNRWIQYIKEDLEAGALKVITEARESGTSGICRNDGELRFGLIEEILGSGVKPSQLIFEAPNKSLQTYFIEKIGPQVNLANVPFSDVIPLVTLRTGLRSDTLMLFERRNVNA